MNIPLLIIGYERSGTTLLRRLVSMHPDLPFEIVHENRHKLFSASSREDAIRLLTYPATQAGKQTGSIMSIQAGQKIPYISFTDAKSSIEKFRYFFPESYILHIIRNPLGAINSQVKTFNKKAHTCIDSYFDSVPKTYEYTRSLKNCSVISYENLIEFPERSLKNIYEWMGSSVQETHIRRVISSREPWDYRGRIMPGLRYFDKVAPTSSSNLLTDEDIGSILKKKIEYMFDF